MTDITELAKSLKAAADREMICRDVAETSEIWERTVTPENILALVEALEKSEKTSEARREAIDRAHNMFVRERDRANAAEEALEKAQQQTTESENRVRKQNRHICELFDDNTALRQRIAELEEAQSMHESDTLMLCRQFDELAAAMGWSSELAMQQGVSQLEYARSLKERIAELESCTVTVNLPELREGAE